MTMKLFWSGLLFFSTLMCTFSRIMMQAVLRRNIRRDERGATKRFISLGAGMNNIFYITWCFFNICIKIEKKALILNWSLFQILRSFPADFLNWFDKVLTQVNLLHCLLTLSKLMELLSWRVQWKTHWTRIKVQMVKLNREVFIKHSDLINIYFT